MPGSPDDLDDASAHTLAHTLDDLQRRSEERTRELREIAAQLPAMTGRRAVVRMLVSDAVYNTNRQELWRRSTRRIGRLPGRVVRSVRRTAPSQQR